jgi:carbonic anhydrase
MSEQGGQGAEVPPVGTAAKRKSRKWKIAGIVVLLVAVFVAFLGWTDAGRRTQFMLGGGLVELGYLLQDRLESYDFHHTHDISPEDVWNEMLQQNSLTASVRAALPRTPRHPLVALVVCMDARLDTNELVGDTRHYYYIIRTAGSVLSEREEEMLELAVQNGVEVIVLTTHTDCAAEKVAANPEMRRQFPALTKAVDERDQRIAELLARPAIASRVAAGKLLVKQINIDTMTEKLLPRENGGAPVGKKKS